MPTSLVRRRRLNTRLAKSGRARVTSIAVCSAIAFALAGCSSGSGQADSDEPVTLQFWTYSVKGNDPEAQAIVERYHEENPNVTVELSEVGGTADTAAKLRAADRADEAPDIVQVEYFALPSLVSAGVVKNITEDVSDVHDKIDQNIWDLTTFNGQVYGVPQDIGPMMLTYRADLFDEYGIDVPTTWDEYADAAVKIREADPEAYIASFSATQFEFFAAHAAQAGAEWWSTDGEAWSVGIDSKESLAVADYWQDLVERDLVKVEPLLTPEWNAQVNSGKILSWAAASWAPSVIYSVAPDTAGKWKSAPLPEWTPGEAAVPFLGGSTYLVPEKSRHAEAAAEFAAWLGASDEGSKMLLNLDIFPAGNAGREATLSADPPSLMPEQANFYEVADEVISNTTIPVTWGPNVNYASSAFGDALNKAALNKTSFRKVFEDTQKAVVANLKKQGYTVVE